MALGIRRIWKKFEEKFQRTVDLYSKIGTIEEEKGDLEESEKME